MSDVCYVSEIGEFNWAEFTQIMADNTRKVARANIHRYVNKFGKINEYFDYVDEDGVVIASAISTNVESYQ